MDKLFRYVRTAALTTIVGVALTYALGSHMESGQVLAADELPGNGVYRVETDTFSGIATIEQISPGTMRLQFDTSQGAGGCSLMRNTRGLGWRGPCNIGGLAFKAALMPRNLEATHITGAFTDAQGTSSRVALRTRVAAPDRSPTLAAALGH